MEESGPSILFTIRGYLTPTVLFLLLNVVILTIVLTSRNIRRHHQENEPNPNHHHHQPTPLERVRSIGLFRFGSRDLPPEHSDRIHHHQQPYHQDPHPTALERVRSIGLFGFGSRDLPPEHSDRIHHQQPPYHQDPHPTALERVKSIGLFRFGSRDLPPAEAVPVHNHNQTPPEPASEPAGHYYDMDHHFRRIQSESAASRPKPALAAEGGSKLRKLASALSWRSSEAVTVQRRPAARREEAVAVDEEVDARADDFINRFKQQLRLQRLDSIMKRR